MASFGHESEIQLISCHPDLVKVLRKALDLNIIDFKVLVGHRNKEDQDAAFVSGNSKLKWPFGKHNSFPSKAVDIAPYPIQWKDRESFIFLAGVILVCAKLEGIELRYGGDWDGDKNFLEENFRDYGHFEIKDV